MEPENRNRAAHSRHVGNVAHRLGAGRIPPEFITSTIRRRYDDCVAGAQLLRSNDFAVFDTPPSKSAAAFTILVLGFGAHAFNVGYIESGNRSKPCACGGEWHRYRFH